MPATKTQDDVPAFEIEALSCDMHRHAQPKKAIDEFDQFIAVGMLPAAMELNFPVIREACRARPVVASFPQAFFYRGR